MERRDFIKFTFATATQAVAGTGLTALTNAVHASPGFQNAIKNALILTNWEANPGRSAPVNDVEGLRDGVVGGYGGNPSNRKHEWVTNGIHSSVDTNNNLIPANAVVHLIWADPIPVSSVELFDRPNVNDQILSGYIVSDDGTQYPFGALEKRALSGLTVGLSGKVTRSLTVVIVETSATTINVGLSEVIVNSTAAGVHPKRELPELSLSVPDLAPNVPTDGNVVVYNKAWQYAMEHISYNENLPQKRFMDEACWNNGIWPWDSMFMSQYCKYAPKMMPGVESLDNFYRLLHGSDSAKGMQLCVADNPPLYGWAEYNNYLTTGNNRTNDLVYGKQWLIKEFNWRTIIKRGTIPNNSVILGEPPKSDTRFFVDVNMEWELNGAKDGIIWSGGHSGMDNTPRQTKGKVYWVDAISQHGMQALYIAKFFEKSRDFTNGKVWRDKFRTIKNVVQNKYWDPNRGLFMDRFTTDGRFSDVATVATFWPMLAEMATQDQAEKLVAALNDPLRFGGEIPFVSLSRSDPLFEGAKKNITNDPNRGRGDYWRGGVWMPTSYMGMQGLMKYGYMAEAKNAAKKTMRRIINTYYNTEFPRKQGEVGGTIWECYSPEGDKPSTENGRTARIDFCGWSALGPISMQIECCLGLYRIDAITRTVYWWWDGERNMRISNLSLMGDTVASFSVDQNGLVSVSSDKAFTLVMNGFVQEIQANVTNWIANIIADNGSNNFAEASVTLDTGFDPDATYYIHTAAKTALTVKNDATVLNQPVVQQSLVVGRESQKFQLQRDDGLFQIVPKGVLTSAAIALSGKSGDWWFKAEAPSSDKRQQKFTIVGNSKDGYLIRCVSTNEVVTSAEGNALRTASYDAQKSLSQRWFLTKA